MGSRAGQLSDDFLGMLSGEEAPVYKEIIDFLAGLGYFAQKQKVQGYVLSFKHHRTKHVIAKMGIPGGKNQRAFIRVKFFAVKNAPEKLSDALRREIASHNGQYCRPLRDAVQKNKCGFCGACTGGGLGYYYQYPDGREVVRCGAYPIAIPDIAPGDTEALKRAFLEQHQYHMSIA